MSQSKGNLNPDKQILYLVQWFAEFSEFQRKDFLIDHLSQIYCPFFRKNLFFPNDDNEIPQQQQNGSSNGDGVGANQMPKENGSIEESLSNDVNNLDISSSQSRPPSIFQCRMKLFKEWYQTQWSDQDRVEFLLRLKNIDSEFVWDFYRLLLKEHDLLDYEKFSEKIQNNDSVKNLSERLDLLNNLIYTQPKSEIKNQPADLTQNGFNYSETNKHTPDLLMNCQNPSVLETKTVLEQEKTEKIHEQTENSAAAIINENVEDQKVEKLDLVETTSKETQQEQTETTNGQTEESSSSSAPPDLLAANN